jgi:hypothetical protein
VPRQQKLPISGVPGKMPVVNRFFTNKSSTRTLLVMRYTWHKPRCGPGISNHPGAGLDYKRHSASSLLSSCATSPCQATRSGRGVAPVGYLWSGKGVSISFKSRTKVEACLNSLIEDCKHLSQNTNPFSKAEISIFIPRHYSYATETWHLGISYDFFIESLHR